MAPPQPFEKGKDMGNLHCRNEKVNRPGRTDTWLYQWNRRKTQEVQRAEEAGNIFRVHLLLREQARVNRETQCPYWRSASHG